jgi:hypothetical protein
LGARPLTKHANHRDIYWTKLYPLPGIPAVKQYPELLSLYSAEFGKFS